MSLASPSCILWNSLAPPDPVISDGPSFSSLFVNSEKVLTPVLCTQSLFLHLRLLGILDWFSGCWCHVTHVDLCNPVTQLSCHGIFFTKVESDSCWTYCTYSHCSFDDNNHYLALCSWRWSHRRVSSDGPGPLSAWLHFSSSTCLRSATQLDPLPQLYVSSTV